MEYEKTSRGLIFKADNELRQHLRELREADPDGFASDRVMFDLFEHFTCNSDYDWIPEGTTGDLTSAPMLGVRGETVPGPSLLGEDGSGYIFAGCWHDKWGQVQHWFQPVIERYAYMNYEVSSPQEDLLDTGETFFEGGSYLAEVLITEEQERLLFEQLQKGELTPSDLRLALSRAGIAVTDDEPAAHEGSEVT